MADQLRIQGGRFAIVPEWMSDRAELSDGAVRTWIVLYLYAGQQDSEAWPGIKALASRRRQSERTIQRQLRELEAIGALTVEPWFDTDGNGRQTSNVYTLCPNNPKTSSNASQPPGDSRDAKPAYLPGDGDMGDGGPHDTGVTGTYYMSEREPEGTKPELARCVEPQRPAATAASQPALFAIKQETPQKPEPPTTEPFELPSESDLEALWEADLEAQQFLRECATLAGPDFSPPPTVADALAVGTWLRSTGLEPLDAARRLHRDRPRVCARPGILARSPDAARDIAQQITAGPAARAPSNHRDGQPLARGIPGGDETRAYLDAERAARDALKDLTPEQLHDRKLRRRRIAQAAGLLPPDAELDRPKTPAPRIKPLRLADGAAAVQSGPGGARDAPEP